MVFFDVSWLCRKFGKLRFFRRFDFWVYWWKIIFGSKFMVVVGNRKLRFLRKFDFWEYFGKRIFKFEIVVIVQIRKIMILFEFTILGLLAEKSFENEKLWLSLRNYDFFKWRFWRIFSKNSSNSKIVVIVKIREICFFFANYR